MTEDKSNYINSFDILTNVDDRVRGVAFINDLSHRSDFAHQKWGMTIIRPKSIKCEKKLNSVLNNEKLAINFSDPYLDMLVDHVTSKLKLSQGPNEESFFIVVSFDESQLENFSLLFSEAADVKLVEHVEKNFSFSKQKFRSSKSYENVLFKKIEALVPGVSCFELRFGKSSDKFVKDVYSKERVFEETIIYSNITILKMI